jgi:hypothetical protein
MKQENMTQNKKKSQSKNKNWEMIQMIELAAKH